LNEIVAVLRGAREGQTRSLELRMNAKVRSPLDSEWLRCSRKQSDRGPEKRVEPPARRTSPARRVAYAYLYGSPRHAGHKAENVAEAHRKDLEIQDEYGVKYMTYWYDAERGTGFCLVDAPDAATAAHNALVRRGLAIHAGREVKHTGDGIMATFNEVTNAVRAAAEIRRKLLLRPRSEREEAL
jgi:hypothetical protein